MVNLFQTLLFFSRNHGSAAKITLYFFSVPKGVFTGYSAMSVAMALPPDGRVVACDVSQEYTDVGKPFWKEVSEMECRCVV